MMKLIIVSLMVSLAACGNQDHASHNHSHTHDHSHDGGHEHGNIHGMAVPLGGVYGKARKIQSTPSSFGADDNCPLQCLNQMQNDVKGDSELSEYLKKFTKPFRFAGQYNVQMLTKYCKLVNKTIGCVRPCSEGQVKSVATKAFSLPKYICVDTRYMEYAPCYDKVSKVNDLICDGANKCGPKKTSLENSHRNIRNKDDVERMLSDTCNYISCNSECDHPKVVAECGAEPARVLAALYRQSVSVMFDLFTQMGITVSRPATCLRLMASEQN